MTVRNGVVLVIVVASMATSARAQSGWRMIGQREMGPDAGSATIAAHDDGLYREYILCLEGGGARLLDAQLHYRDNRVQTNRIRESVRDGSCSRSAMLGGRDRNVATVDVGYEPASLQGSRPRIQLFVR